MVEYLTTLEDMRDSIMDDGTTAFAMALARRDEALVKILLSSDLPSDIDPKELARRAIMELSGNSIKGSSGLWRELVNGLQREETCQQSVVACTLNLIIVH